MEERKLVDLICADRSIRTDSDDLDLWAHVGDYARRHGGNLGDASDPFEGVRFRRLELETSRAKASSGLRLDVRPQAGGLELDVRMPHWSGQLHGDVEWLGQILVDGDLTVAPDARLTIYPYAGPRRDGSDGRRCRPDAL
jgi:hypothetical protein